MLRLFGLLLLLGSAADAQPADTLASPWTLARQAPGESFWAPLLRLRAAEEAYRGSDAWWSAYAQYRAQMEATAGRPALALAFWDAPLRRGRDSVGVLPPGVRAMDAAEWIAAAADTARVVMVNERHHAAADRLLTLRLLPLLHARGFRYLAVEALSHEDSALNARPYPVDASGFYTNEPVFAEMLREARRLGFTLVPYEIRDAQRGADTTRTPQQQRDFSQAQNLVEAVFRDDPDARVLVHAGFGHIYETESPSWSPMAFYLRQLAGIDPLTVDQTALSERSAPVFEHPAYRAALAAGLLSDAPVVLTDADGTLLAPTRTPVDVQVFGPRARTHAGERHGLATVGQRQARDIVIAECIGTWCGAEVRMEDESADAVPLDRTETDADGRVRLRVPAGPALRLRVETTGGRVVRDERLP